MFSLKNDTNFIGDIYYCDEHNEPYKITNGDEKIKLEKDCQNDDEFVYRCQNQDFHEEEEFCHYKKYDDLKCGNEEVIMSFKTDECIDDGINQYVYIIDEDKIEKYLFSKPNCNDRYGKYDGSNKFRECNNDNEIFQCPKKEIMKFEKIRKIKCYKGRIVKYYSNFYKEEIYDNEQCYGEPISRSLIKYEFTRSFDKVESLKTPSILDALECDNGKCILNDEVIFDEPVEGMKWYIYVII